MDTGKVYGRSTVHVNGNDGRRQPTGWIGVKTDSGNGSICSHRESSDSDNIFICSDSQPILKSLQTHSVIHKNTMGM